MTAPHTVVGHTAGPWFPMREGLRAYVMYHDAEFGRDLPVTSLGLPALDSNLQLMAAAPDMVEALHCALTIVRDAPRTLGRDLAEAKIIAAIAKATAGRQSGEDA